MAAATMTPSTTGGTIEAAAARLSVLLTSGGGGLADPGGSTMEFESVVELRPLSKGTAPHDVWAVDGGQAVVADAGCLQVVMARAARARFRAGCCVVEDEGPWRAHLLGGGESGVALAGLGLDLAPQTAIDLNLIRDRWEWDAVGRCLEEADPGALVLVDGDLVADWRISPGLVGDLLQRATAAGVLVSAVTKRSSLSRGGAPLLGQLELEAEAALGSASRWWAPLARIRGPEGSGADVRVVVARLDPAARFAFRIDLPADADPETALGRMAAVSDDAGFPGYPYPLTVADRLAACPTWLRDEARLVLDEALERSGVPYAVRERAFADRHRLMERA